MALAAGRGPGVGVASTQGRGRGWSRRYCYGRESIPGRVGGLLFGGDGAAAVRADEEGEEEEDGCCFPWTVWPDGSLPQCFRTVWQRNRDVRRG